MKIGEETSKTDGRGATLRIKRVSARSYILRVDGQQHCRWATYQREIDEDVAFFMDAGRLPRSAAAGWA